MKGRKALYTTEKSLELFETAQRVIPGGVQKARHPANFTEKYPIFMESGNGAHVVDVDGNEYIDWLLSYGPIVLGHCYRKVDDVVLQEMRSGFLLNLTQPLQLELGSKLIELIPCAEKVLLVSTGSGATSAAVRIARLYTGREKIVRWGYHGWHDWSCPTPGAGIPNGTGEGVLSFLYNNLDSLQSVMEANKGEIACIIMMPLEIEIPKKGFLEGVREIANRYGAVLIFDEVRSWPRMGLGGAQEYYGVTPDMTTLSKGIANGYPVSAVVGKASIMDTVSHTTVSATYFPSTLGISAALATIDEMEKENVISHLWNIGKELAQGLISIAAQKKVNAHIMGESPMPFLIFGDPDSYTGTWYEDIYRAGYPGTDRDRLLMKAFFNETIVRGVFFHPRHHWFSCYSHTKQDVDRTLEVAEECLDIAIKKT
jgi:glutamate-1-semialdehyde aminotransferase